MLAISLADGVVVPDHDVRWLAFIGLGAVLAFFGLIFVANLFGVADEQARSIARSWFFLGRSDAAKEPRSMFGMKLGRYGAGGGFMLVGILMMLEGLNRLL